MAGKRRRRNAAEWAALVKQWEESGLSVERFAEQAELNAERLARWSCRLRQTQSSRASRTQRSRAPQSTAATFLPVRVVGSTEPASSAASYLVEVVLTNGRVVRVPPGVPSAQLSALLQVVEGGGSC